METAYGDPFRRPPQESIWYPPQETPSGDCLWRPPQETPLGESLLTQETVSGHPSGERFVSPSGEPLVTPSGDPLRRIGVYSFQTPPQESQD
jgi:hypothetical protein